MCCTLTEDRRDYRYNAHPLLRQNAVREGKTRLHTCPPRPYCGQRVQLPHRYRRQAVANGSSSTIISVGAAVSFLAMRNSLKSRDGLDFRHGLGHGVGSYLAVHESRSHRVSHLSIELSLARVDPSAFRGSTIEPGHVTSIEPGFYANGEFGIRIESVYLCQNVDVCILHDMRGKLMSRTDHVQLWREHVAWLGTRHPGQYWTFIRSFLLARDRITELASIQVPIQTFLCDWNLMSKDEIRWINAHNTSVEDALLPLLQEDQDKEARDWLKSMCKPKKLWPWTGA